MSGGASEDRARLFVAALPPPATCAALASLARPVVDGVRWTTPAQWHITLRFLGQADIASAVAALGAVSAGRAEVRLGPSVEPFGDGAGVLALLAAGLDTAAIAVALAFASVGEPAPPRPFRGHLTLARLHRGRAPDAAALRRAGAVGSPVDLRFVAEDIVLVRSLTRPTGAEYRVLATQSLGR